MVRLYSQLAAATLALSVGSLTGAALAADCVVDAYDVYRFATTQSRMPFGKDLLFTCEVDGLGETEQARFEADAAEGLICTGVSGAADTGPVTVRADLFAAPGTSVWTANGWHIADYETSGGPLTRRHRRDTLISFTFEVSGRGSAFRYQISSITLAKPDGGCDRALEEAFGW